MADAKKQSNEASLQAELDQLRRKLTLFADLTRKMAATLDPTDLLSLGYDRVVGVFLDGQRGYLEALRL